LKLHVGLQFTVTRIVTSMI